MPTMAGLSHGNGVMNGASKGDISRPQKTQRHIWIVGGPAGCGKSTIAKHLADNMGIPYIEGDEVRRWLCRQEQQS